MYQAKHSDLVKELKFLIKKLIIISRIRKTIIEKKILVNGELESNILNAIPLL
tara:strand:- start:9849 stop:10007 length:159 start_codon:yes stop_codon:yes gene_type:complete